MLRTISAGMTVLAVIIGPSLALLIHPKQPVRTGLGAILRERHGTAIASSDDDTAAAV